MTIVLFELGLHLVAIGGLAHISLLIHNGKIQEAVVTSITTAFCVLAIGWALAKVKTMMDD